MSGLFGGGSGQAMPQLPKPTPVRMPEAQDTSMLEAARRRRELMMRRSGRASTILSDNLRDPIGSSGQKLGA